MISALSGRLQSITETTAHLEVGPVVFELLVSAADVRNLADSIGQSITFQTLVYLEGDPNRGNLEPRMIGFTSRRDKAFFNRFTEVKGIGPKKALKALTLPIPDVARAIESHNTRFLTELPQVGRRLAELIIAELSGKLGAFTEGAIERHSITPRRSTEEDAALAILTSPQTGLRRAEAEEHIERVKHEHPELKTRDELLDVIMPLLNSLKG